MKAIFRAIRNDSGATAIEYALIASLISMVILGGLSAVGTNTFNNFYNKIAEATAN